MERKGRRWVLQLRWHTPKPQVVTAPMLNGLEATVRFIKWGRLDPTTAFKRTARMIYDEVRRLDDAQEARED